MQCSGSIYIEFESGSRVPVLVVVNLKKFNFKKIMALEEILRSAESLNQCCGAGASGAENKF